MTKWRWIAAALIAALGLSAVGVALALRSSPDKASPLQAPLELSGSEALLWGQVTDAVSGDAVAGARVKADHAGGTAEVRSDASGDYSLVVDASRPIAVTVAASGYKGVAAFGALCPGRRERLEIELVPAGAGAPQPPIVIGRESCP